MIRKAWIASILAACAALGACSDDGGDPSIVKNDTSADGGSGAVAGVSGSGAAEGSGAADGSGGAGGDSAGATGAVGSGGASDGGAGSGTGSGASSSGGGPSATCGDGAIGAGEGCDDGNTAAGDGCSAVCALEVGFTCAGEPSTCTTICGDGFIVGAEDCEDGNTDAGDGCSPTCTFEGVCGDGTVQPGESCDDGNAIAGDGCDASCQLEPGTPCGSAVDLGHAGVMIAGVLVYDGDTTPSMNTTYGNPSCSSGTTGVKRVIHRYQVGEQAAVLKVETMDIGGALNDTTVWAYDDCQDPGVELGCDDNDGPGKYSLFTTPILPAGRVVFIVVAGYNHNDVGAYQLHVTETPTAVVPSPGTCAAPRPVGSGTYIGETAANGPNSAAGSCTGAAAPDSVFTFTLQGPTDLTATVSTPDLGYDVGLYLTGAPCGSGMEVPDGCKDELAEGAPETLSLRNLPAGTYYLVVDSFAPGGAGHYSLSVDIAPILPLGASCVPGSVSERCANGTYCIGAAGSEACSAPAAVLLSADFSEDLAPFEVVDADDDGLSWAVCSEAEGCLSFNGTGSFSGGGMARVEDYNEVEMNGEGLVTPPLDAAGRTLVLLAFDQVFDHFEDATDLGAVELSTDNVTWTPVASFTRTTIGHQMLDITSLVVGQASFRVRFRYDDQTAGGDPQANGWTIDDVNVVAF